MKILLRCCAFLIIYFTYIYSDHNILVTIVVLILCVLIVELIEKIAKK